MYTNYAHKRIQGPNTMLLYMLTTEVHLNDSIYIFVIPTPFTGSQLIMILK